MTRPTFRNLNESFEGWAYRSGLLRRINWLEKQGFIERRNQKQRIYRLTSAGRLRALGGRDPEAQWSRPWDGWWRLACFDVPTTDNQQRKRLTHYLRSRWFGLLQRSIWITPDDVQEQQRILRSTDVDVKSLILLQAQTCGGESDRDIVSSAWDFDRINSRYKQHLGVLQQRPVQRINSSASANALRRWAEAEQASWNHAVRLDPLLPEVLLPSSYLGKRAWRRRTKILAACGEIVKSFKP
jgi:DNA-binding transcriptional regulator PaaX